MLKPLSSRLRRLGPLLALLCMNGAPTSAAPGASPPAPMAASYGKIAEKIRAAARADNEGWTRLEYLTDRIGYRLSGMAGLDQAIAWAAQTFRADGQDNVHLEKVMVPHWERGEESAMLLSPHRRPLAMLGLGGSPATPKNGITAEVVVVRDFEELEALGDKVKGKMVLVNFPLPPFDPENGAGFKLGSLYRREGASHASKQGAVAGLARSVTGHSLGAPHAGTSSFAKGVTPIPVAALSVEDAELLGRLAAAGQKPKVQLKMNARTFPDAPSANVIAELRGRERPDEIVLVGAHTDSWDVGQGAHDDGVGVAVCIQSLALLRRLGLVPRRTIRVVLFTNEETGLRGATEYVKLHAAELPKHVAALEVDDAGWAPAAVRTTVQAPQLERVRELVRLVAPLGVSRVKGTPLNGGNDVEPLAPAGVPLFTYEPDQSRVYDHHHSPADTLDKVNPQDFRSHLAAVATLAYVLADMPDTLRSGPPGKAVLDHPGAQKSGGRDHPR
jgi:carboxypeptidase Q